MTYFNHSRSYSTIQKILIFLVISLTYFLVGWTSLKLATVNNLVSPVWFPSGIAISFLLVFGARFTPAVFVGALLTNLSLSHFPLGLLGISLGNTLEAYTGALLISWIHQKNFFKSYNDIISIIIASIFSTLISATTGSASLLLGEMILSQDFAYIWYTWWSGDALGILILVPLCLEFFRFKHSQQRLRHFAFFLIFLTTVAAITILVFINNYNQAFSWIICPILILSGIVINKFASRILFVLLAILIVVLTKLGHGPFEFGSLNLNLIYIQALLVSYSFAVMFVQPLNQGLRTGKVFLVSNIIGWSCIFGIIYVMTSIEKNHLQKDLTAAITGTLEDIKGKTQKYELLLKSGEALLQTIPRIEQQEWKDYVTSLKITDNYRALLGFGFVRYVKKTDIDELIKELSSRGVKQFKVQEINPDFAKNYHDRFLITLLEPQESERRVLGLDVGSEKRRREAALISKSTRLPKATELITLASDEQKRPAFLLLNPVWINQNEFRGWTYAPILSNVFFSRSVANFSNLLNVKITQNNQILYQNYTDQHFNSIYTRKIKTQIFGNDALIEFNPTREFFSRYTHSSAPLSLILSLFMLFIAGFLLEQLTFGQKTEILIKKRTAELEESKIQLINSSKMASLGEMASGMAHEINNPITIILGKIKVISMMLEDLKINSPALNHEMNRIESTAERIGKIVKGLKSFSRSADSDPFELVPVEIIIQETLDMCSEKLKASGITIQIDEIPEICLYCRSSQISQVLLNLINNSSDALASTQNKIISIRVKIKEPDRVLIYICDNGHGIEAEIAHKIMDPFFTTKEVGKGTGLGLSIAKSIMEGHGGSIWLDEASNDTCFVLEFPIKA